MHKSNKISVTPPNNFTFVFKFKGNQEPSLFQPWDNSDANSDSVIETAIKPAVTPPKVNIIGL